MCMEKLQDSQTLPILYLMGTTHYVFLSCIFFLNLQQSTADVYAAVASELKITRIVLQTHFTSAQIDIWRGASVDHQTAFGKTGPACKKLTTSMFRGKLKMFLWSLIDHPCVQTAPFCTVTSSHEMNQLRFWATWRMAKGLLTLGLPGSRRWSLLMSSSDMFCDMPHLTVAKRCQE